MSPGRRAASRYSPPPAASIGSRLDQATRARSAAGNQLTRSAIESAAEAGARRGFRSAVAHVPTKAELHSELFRHYALTGVTRREMTLSKEYDLTEVRDLAASSGTGAYLVPPDFADELLHQLRYANAILGHSQLWITDGGAPARFPTLVDASNAATNQTENSQMTGNNDPVFGQVSFGQCPQYTLPDLVKVGRAEMQDSHFPIEDVLMKAFVQTLRHGLDRDFIPTLLAGVTNVITTSAAGSLSWGDLLNAYYSIDLAYRANAIWLLSTTTVKQIRSLTDTAGRPFLIDTPTIRDDDGVQAARVPLLFGAPVYESANFGVYAAGNTVGILVDLSHAFVVRQAEAPAIIRLNERYADAGQIAFDGFARMDGRVALAEAAAVVKIHS